MRLIDADELLVAMESWDKFGVRPDNTVVRLGAYDRCFMPYVHYEDMVKCVKGMPTIDDAEIRRQTLKEVESAMYHECFEVSHDEDGMQKWDGGNWIRYKLFEKVMERLEGGAE